MRLKSTTKLSRFGFVLCSTIFVLGIMSETLSFCVDQAIDVFYFQPIYGPNGKIAKLTAVLDSFKEEPALEHSIAQKAGAMDPAIVSKDPLKPHCKR